MRPGDRAKFDWHPDQPVDAFECILVTNGESVPDRGFAVTIEAHDADGALVPPTTQNWLFSDALGTHFQYAPGTTHSAASRLASWNGSAIPQKFHIEAVAWPSGGSNIPDTIALGVSAVPADPTAARTWQLLTPQREDHE